MKIISIDSKDIIFLSLFLTFGEIQPCLFEYLKRENIDLSLLIPLLNKHKRNDNPIDNPNDNPNDNPIDNPIDNPNNKLYSVTNKLKNEFLHFKKSKKNHTTTYFDKPTPYIIFNIPKNIPEMVILRPRYNDTYSFILDYIYNYLSSEYITIIDENTRKNIDKNSFITTLNNTIDDTQPFYKNHNITLIIDSDLSRELIIRFGFINLLNGKTNKMAYEDLNNYFNTYNLKWLKYIKGSYKKLLVIYLSIFAFYKNNKLLITHLSQNIELLKLLRSFIFIFSNSNSNIKLIGRHIIENNVANTFYDSQTTKMIHLYFKNVKMLNFSDDKLNNFLDCRKYFLNFKKEFIVINHMFYYNALLNNAFH